MDYRSASKRLRERRADIGQIREEMRKLQAEIEPEFVEDYAFETSGDRKVTLAELFGDHDELFVIHNMGKSCPSCTLWADGFNGVLGHLESRAAFVVCSPDAPEVQREFAASRGWKFRMISHRETHFAEDMGYSKDGSWWPGVSVFQKRGDRIVRVSDAEFGYADDFCNVWHLFDLLPGGSADWEPRFVY